MADRLKRAAAWLGLVTDDRYSEYDDQPGQDEPTAGVPTEASRPEDSKVTNLETKRPAPTVVSATATAPQPAAPRPSVAPRPADISRIITVHPRTFNEARTIGEHFRDGVPVIMNLTEMDDSDARRLVDFAAGLIFAVRGSIDRVTSKVFLLSPPNINVTAEDKERIAGGFFNQS
ncbi:cell division protein SepF [Microlunatus speluncae]|uniref:cell division protein SepF n=1 Tax=Microlunatus speluncae TaxID=2594267 RepID=UPI0012661A96|nr:cell division protein SepF [Microlunatus speluncae]